MKVDGRDLHVIFLMSVVKLQATYALVMEPAKMTTLLALRTVSVKVTTLVPCVNDMNRINAL